MTERNGSISLIFSKLSDLLLERVDAFRVPRYANLSGVFYPSRTLQEY
jgi:hypothetical protein